MPSTFETVAEIIADTCDKELDSITPESHAIRDLGIDPPLAELERIKAHFAGASWIFLWSLVDCSSRSWLVVVVTKSAAVIHCHIGASNPRRK